MQHNIEDIKKQKARTYLAMYILLEKDSDFETSENMKEERELNKTELRGQIPGTRASLKSSQGVPLRHCTT